MFSFHYFWNLYNIYLSQNIWCLLKILLNHCAQTIFQGGSPWASLILNSMIVPGILYCVQPFSEVKHMFFILSFYFSFCFWWLHFILLEIFTIFIIFQNIWCRLKKRVLNHCAQTIFQGGSPWASLILNSMIVPGILYCVQPFSEVKHMFFILSSYFSFCFWWLGSPWASLILNSMIVPGILYCVQPFSEAKKICSFIRSFSFSYCFYFHCILLHFFYVLFHSC